MGPQRNRLEDAPSGGNITGLQQLSALIVMTTLLQLAVAAVMRHHGAGLAIQSFHSPPLAAMAAKLALCDQHSLHAPRTCSATNGFSGPLLLAFMAPLPPSQTVIVAHLRLHTR